MVVTRVLVMRMVEVDDHGGNQGVSGNGDAKGSSGEDIDNGHGGAGDSRGDNDSNRM